MPTSSLSYIKQVSSNYPKASNSKADGTYYNVYQQDSYGIATHIPVMAEHERQIPPSSLPEAVRQGMVSSLGCNAPPDPNVMDLEQFPPLAPPGI